MKTLIYSMSLNGEMSVTLHSTRYLQDVYSKSDTFEEIKIPMNGVLTDDSLAKFKDADLVVFATSMYHFLIASQAMESMAAIGEYMKANCPGKPVTYFMTSNFLQDVLVHDYIRIWARNYGMKYIKGISIFSDDVVEKRYRADIFAWFNNVKALAQEEKITVKRDMAVKVVLSDESEETKALAKQYGDALKEAGAAVTEIDMCKYEVRHCHGCQYCYTTRKCFIEDQFNQLAKDIEANADLVIYVSVMENGFFSTTFKRFMDRHVCMGRCPIDDETITIFAYHEGKSYVAGDEALFTAWAKSYTSFGGEVLVDVCKGFDPEAVRCAVAAFNENIAPYRDFYWAALRTRFAELARVIKNIEPLDYVYFEKEGMYNVPPVNPNCRAITNMEGAKKSVEMKSMAVRIYRTQGGDMNVPVPERRNVNRDKSLVERAIDPVYAHKETEEAKPEKKKFKLFGGKN